MPCAPCNTDDTGSCPWITQDGDVSETGKRIHGFQKPLCFRQVLSWILGFIDIVFFAIAGPFTFSTIPFIVLLSVCCILLFSHPIRSFYKLFLVATAVALTIGISVTLSNPTDKHTYDPDMAADKYPWQTEVLH